MIRINLLPRAAVSRGSSIRNQLIVAGAAVLLSLLGIFFIPGFGYFPVNARITQLDKDIATEEEKLKQVQEYRKKLDEIKKLNKSIEEKLKIIDDIEKKRTGPVWMMDEVTDAVSRFRIMDNKTGKEISKYYDDKEMKIFLNRFDVTATSLSIEGVAQNNTFLVAFLNNLKSKCYLFSNVVLYFSDQTSYQGALVRSFRITTDVNMLAKPGSVAATGGVTCPVSTTPAAMMVAPPPGPAAAAASGPQGASPPAVAPGPPTAPGAPSAPGGGGAPPPQRRE